MGLQSWWKTRRATALGGSEPSSPWSGTPTPPRNLLPPTMLSDEELSYLAWLTESAYEGWGAIVDLGPWLGGSACALAEGLRRRDRNEKITALDNFVWRRTYMEGVHAADLPDHSDFRFLFDRYTRPFAPWIDARSVDLRHYRWDGGPIEILFVDAAKDWLLMNNILAGFAGSLIPNRSLVVFQDYQHWATYFLPLMVESRPDLWDPVHTVSDGTTASYRARKPIVGPGGVEPGLSRAAFPYDIGAPLLRALADRHSGRSHANFLGVLLRYTALEGSPDAVAALRDEIAAAPEADGVRRSLAEIEDTAQEDTALGWELRAAGRIDDAIAIARKGLERHPGDAYLRILELWCMLSQGHGDEADAKADALVRDHPTAADAWMNRALLHVENERWDEAEADVERGRRLDTAEVPAPEYFQIIGHAHRGRGDRRAALEAYRALAGVSPGWSKPPLWQAWCLWELGLPEDARAALDHALALDPGDTEAIDLREQIEGRVPDSALVSRGWTARETGRFQEALDLAQAALADHPDDPQPRLLELWCLFSIGRPEDARARADALLADLPDFAPGWLNRALLRVEDQQWAEAIADAERGRALAGGSEPSREYLQVIGHAARAQGETDRALEAYRALAEHLSGSPLPHLWQAWTLLEADRSHEARSAALAALAVDPASAEVPVLMKVLDRADAEREAQRVRAQEDAATGEEIARGEALAKGWSLREAGRAAEALVVAQAALEGSPDHPSLRVLRFWCLSDLGEHWRASAEADALVRDEPGFVSGRLNRALFQLERSRWDEAEAEAERVRAIVADAPLPDLYFQILGQARRGREEPAEALAVFDELATRRPDWAKVHVWRGWCLLELARLEDAADAARRARGIDDTDREAVHLEASIAEAQGNTPTR